MKVGGVGVGLKIRISNVSSSQCPRLLDVAEEAVMAGEAHSGRLM